MAVADLPAAGLASDSRQDVPDQESQSQDVGNIILLEHLNLEVLDRKQADVFYADALGLTRDSAMQGHPRVTWYNIGRQQFHIVKGSSSQKTPLPVELILPDLDQLLERLQAAQSSLDGTQFTFHQSDNNTVAVTDPWGQQFCISSPISGSVLTMGIKEITLPCAPGTAAPIGAFYQQVYKARVVHSKQAGARCSRIVAGPGTTVAFLESSQYKHAAEVIRSFEGWHIAFYLTDFSSVFNTVDGLGLNLLQHKHSDKAPTLHEALKCSQFRMSSITALQDSCYQDVQYKAGDVLYSFGHELRSMCHPRFLSSLTNRS